MTEEGKCKYFTDSCTAENVKELFEDLELYGVQSLPEIKQSDSNLCLDDAITLVKSLVNASYHMLYRHRKMLRDYEELEIKRMRDLDDNRALKSTVERLKRDVSEKERALLKREDECKRVKDELVKSQQQLKTQSEETRQLRCQLKYKDKKYAHDERKKDQEINKLQLQLEQRTGACLSQRTRVVASKEEKSQSMKEKEEAYQQIICKFEVNNKNLMLENEMIRRAFYELNSSLASLVEDFYNLLLFLPNEKSEDMNSIFAQAKEQDVQKPTPDSSVEEFIVSSSNYVQVMNKLTDNLKQLYM